MSGIMNDILQDVIKEASIDSCIETSIDCGSTDAEIIDRLQRKYNLSETEAKEQLSKFKTNAQSQ